jgi:hypothetical protein
MLMLQINRCHGTFRSFLLVGAALLVAGTARAQVVVADAGDPITAACTSDSSADVNLDGLGSTVNGASAALDPNTTFLWEAAGIDFSDDTSPTPSAEFPLGTTTVTLTVTFTDPVTLVETISQDTVDVIVEDTTPPTLTLVPNPPSLWPPNHKLVDVRVRVIVNDACDPDPDVELTSLTSSEPDNGTGDGDTSEDIQDADIGTDDRNFELRAERAGNGSGRTYTAVYTATDESDNLTNALTTIVVPHDQGDVKSNKAEKAAAKAAKAAAKAAEKAAKAAKKAAKASAKAAGRGH